MKCSLLLLRDELRSLLGEERLAGASLLILANKQDLPSALESKEIAKVLPPLPLHLPYSSSLPFQTLELESIESHHWRIFPVSAVSGHNLLQSFKWVTDDVASRVFNLD